MMKKSMGSLALALLLLVGMTVPALATGNQEWNDLLNKTVTSIEQLTADRGALTVLGTAAIAVEPDMATITLGITHEDAATATAQKKVNETIAALIGELKAMGIPENKIATISYNVYPAYDYSREPATLKGYQVSEMLNVQIEDFALISQVIDKGVEIGVNQVQNISFDTTKRAELYRQALVNATTAAQQKAEVMAGAAGKQIVKLRDITEAEQNMSMYLNAYDMRGEAANAPQTKILGGQVNVTAQVTLVYDIN